MSPALLPKPAAASAGPEDDVQLSLRDHLMELRKRLKWALIWLLLGFAASYYWSQQIFHFLMLPVFAALPEGEKALHFASRSDIAAVLDYEADLQSEISTTEDSVEGILAFVEKRPPNFKGR